MSWRRLAKVLNFDQFESRMGVVTLLDSHHLDKGWTGGDEVVDDIAWWLSWQVRCKGEGKAVSNNEVKLEVTDQTHL